jgi:uncharacterized Zn-finger protein
MQPFETIYIDSMVVACNGGGGPLGHPKVYLNLAGDGQVECPYCSRLFIHKSKRVGHGVAGHVVETPAATAPHEARGGDHPPPSAPAAVPAAALRDAQNGAPAAVPAASLRDAQNGAPVPTRP